MKFIFFLMLFALQANAMFPKPPRHSGPTRFESQSEIESAFVEAEGLIQKIDFRVDGEIWWDYGGFVSRTGETAEERRFTKILWMLNSSIKDDPALDRKLDAFLHTILQRGIGNVGDVLRMILHFKYERQLQFYQGFIQNYFKLRDAYKIGSEERILFIKTLTPALFAGNDQVYAFFKSVIVKDLQSEHQRKPRVLAICTLLHYIFKQSKIIENKLAHSSKQVGVNYGIYRTSQNEDAKLQSLVLQTDWEWLKNIIIDKKGISDALIYELYLLSEEIDFRDSQLEWLLDLFKKKSRSPRMKDRSDFEHAVKFVLYRNNCESWLTKIKAKL